MTVRPLPLLTALLLAASTAEAKKPREPKEPASVTLAFGWQEGWEGTQHTVKVTTVEDSTKPTRVERLDSVDRVRVERRDGALVAHSEGGVPTQELTIGGEPAPTDAFSTELMTRLSTIPMDVRLGPTGAWEGLVDEAGTLGRVEEAFGAAIATFRAQLPEDRRAAFDAAMGAPVVKGLLELGLQAERSRWHAQVSFWPGATLALRHARVDETDEAPTPDGAGLRWSRMFGAEALEPCSDARGAPTCVRLFLRYTADEAQLAAISRARVPALPGGSEPVLERATRVERYEGLVEPDTLRPWRWERTSTTEVKGSVDGAPQAWRKVEEVETTWAWGPAPAAPGR